MNLFISDRWDMNLAGKTLAIRARHPLIDYFSENYPEINLYKTEGSAKSFEAVANGFADATVENKLQVNRMVADEYAGRLHILGEVDDRAALFAMAVAPRNESVISIINKGLSVLPDNFVSIILSRWTAVDLRSSRDLERDLRILLPLLAMATLFLLMVIYWNRKISTESGQRLMAEQRLLDMTDQLHTGVFQFVHTPGQSLDIEFANNAARNMVVVDDNTSLARGFFSAVDQGDREPLIDSFRKGLRSGQSFQDTFRYNYPDGDKRWILMDVQCRTNNVTGEQTWSGSLFDMTSEHHAERRP